MHEGRTAHLLITARVVAFFLRTLSVRWSLFRLDATTSYGLVNSPASRVVAPERSSPQLNSEFPCSQFFVSSFGGSQAQREDRKSVV